MNQHFAILTAAAVIVLAILYSNGTFEKMPKTQPAYEIAIADKFRDPESTKFRHVIKNKTLKIWCGQVNAKNGFGAYSGWQDFTAIIDPDSNNWNILIGMQTFDYCEGF